MSVYTVLTHYLSETNLKNSVEESILLLIVKGT